MIVGLGIDAVEIDRVDYEKLAGRVFTPAELEYIRKKGAAAAESAAGIFAAKEAALKAIGTGIGELSLNDVWVEHDERGKPILRMGEKCQKVVEFDRLHLSITHTGSIAIAEAILEKNV